jgi:hypothetical protein
MLQRTTLTLCGALAAVCIGACTSGHATERTTGGARPGGLTASQITALEDGVVTDGELADAVAETVDCLANVGLHTRPVLSDPETGLAGGWDFNRESVSDDAAIADCRQRTSGPLEPAYFATQRAHAFDERTSQLTACLAANGIHSGPGGLADLLGSAARDGLLRCDQAVRATPEESSSQAKGKP